MMILWLVLCLDFIKHTLINLQKPPCAGTIHDTVVSRTTVNVVSAIHLIPVIFCIYIFINNLKAQRTDHLFLYIESVDPELKAKAVAK